MSLHDAYVRYLTEHHQGRLATVGPDGTPQVKPVGYQYNTETGTIDISGFTMERSAKYRNVAVHPQVAFVVDDAIGEGAQNMRFVEIRGPAQQTMTPTPAAATPSSWSGRRARVACRSSRRSTAPPGSTPRAPCGRSTRDSSRSWRRRWR